MCLYKSSKGRSDAQRRRLYEDRGRDWVMWPQVKECWQVIGSWKRQGTDFPQEPLARAWPTDSSFGLLASRTVRK